jgi:SAM-dependent methyltransferase
MICPLCNSSGSRRSWMGATVYRGTRFEYQECLGCRSVYVSPMPDRQTLEQMYGDDYGQFISLEEAHSGGEGSENVLSELRSLEPGTFLDYGCGGGYLLREAARSGWRTWGTEFDRAATETLRDQNGLGIVGDLDQIPDDVLFDVIHMGDVIEHLTDVNTEMKRILARLNPRGILIAQGPLEANFNLFLTGLRLKKLLRNSDSSMPPYHVMLATEAGQRELFKRFRLEPLRFDISEAAHPAPGTIDLAGLRNMRLASLYLLRKFSQTFSGFISSSAGNRYFYVGKKIG